MPSTLVAKRALKGKRGALAMCEQLLNRKNSAKGEGYSPPK